MKKLGVLTIVAFLVCSGLLIASAAERQIEWVQVACWEIMETGEVVEDGLKLVTYQGDGLWEVVQREGRLAVQTIPAGHIEYMYLYFELDDEIFFDGPEKGTDLLFTVKYFAEGMTTWTVNYDSWDMDWNLYFPRVQNVFEDEWRVAEMHVNNARFYNRQQGIADFRLAAEPNQKIVIRRITISLACDSKST